MLPTQKPACPVGNVFPGVDTDNAHAEFIAAVKIDTARSVAITFFMSRSPYLATLDVDSNPSKFGSVFRADRSFAPWVAELVVQADADNIHIF
jgi:hypothetical protein